MVVIDIARILSIPNDFQMSMPLQKKVILLKLV